MEQVERWLKEEPWLENLLRWFLDRLNQPRSRAITRRIKPETLSALYQFDVDTDYRWSLIKLLAGDFHVFDIEYQRAKPNAPLYDMAQLRLRWEAEPLLRQWLNAPRLSPALAAWQLAVDQQFGKDHALRNTPVYVHDRVADEVVSTLLSLANSAPSGLTLRELSSRHFWGDSKFLEGREEWMFNVLGLAPGHIALRPLLLTTYAPKGFSRLLFIENQDTFVRAAQLRPQQTALIYSAGFRASATRLSTAAVFSFLAGSDPAEFHVRWQAPNLEIGFWGDLDYSGMGILAALRQGIPQIVAWQPAYSLMLSHLLAGGGHTPAQARKELQRDPGTTGCIYADSLLLPNLRQLKRFVDQELVALEAIIQ